MKKFYIVVNGEQKGPFSLTELEEMRILKSTLAWKEGMNSWVEAGMLEELNSIWKSSPPPLPTLKQKEQENNINVTFGFKTKNKQQTEKKEKKLLNENEQIQIANEIKINFYLLLISIVIAIISLPIIARKDFKAQSLRQKWEKVKYDENSGDKYVSNLKKEIEGRVDKQTFFRFSDSSELFKEYNPANIPILKVDNYYGERIVDKTNDNIKKRSIKIDKHRTASENAEYYWEIKNFEYFDYPKFINSTRDTALINRWNNKSQSEEFKKQEEYNELKYQISGLLTPEQTDVQGSLGGMCNIFQPVDQNSPLGSGLSVRHWDYDCIFTHYGNVFKSNNMELVFLVFLITFAVLIGGRYLFILTKKSIKWVNNNSNKKYDKN